MRVEPNFTDGHGNRGKAHVKQARRGRKGTEELRKEKVRWGAERQRGLPQVRTA